MSSFFSQLWVSAQPNFEAAFAEPMLVEPWVTDTRTSKYVRASTGNPAIPVLNIMGIFTDNVVASRVLGAGANTHENIDMMSDNAQISFDASYFNDTNMPVDGWQVVLTSRPGQPIWRISSVRPDSVARVVVSVTFVKLSQVTP